MRIIDSPTSFNNLWSARETAFDDMMKIVVDIDKGMMAADAELHADLETLLLENGSKTESIWGANLFPDKGIDHPDFIEYTALINIRPAMGNASMHVLKDDVRGRIHDIVHKLLVG
jgi:hypothetical protein